VALVNVGDMSKIKCEYCNKYGLADDTWDMTIHLGMNLIICPVCKEEKGTTVDYCMCPECRKLKDKIFKKTIGAWDK
jgi:hypothetical protein